MIKLSQHTTGSEPRNCPDCGAEFIPFGPNANTKACRWCQALLCPGCAGNHVGECRPEEIKETSNTALRKAFAIAKENNASYAVIAIDREGVRTWEVQPESFAGGDEFERGAGKVWCIVNPDGTALRDGIKYPR